MIQVEISDLWVFIEGKHAIATFVQHYQNQQIKDFGKKTLVLENSNNSWKIISEEWKPLLMPDRMPRVRADAGADIEFNNKSQSIRQDDSSRKFKDSSTQKTLVNDINFQVKDNWEGVCIVLNKFSIPRVQAFEGDKPRIEIDILEVSYWNGDSRIPVNGKRIRQIRTSLNRDLEKLRVFLDLNPAEDYIINQTYLKSDNIYCIEVR
ncbi:MAG: hypothetical protein KKH68_03345 [Proteobacteria bacterium]|nr:hypothetical protein [Pseudomonadota bacterium]